MQNVVGLVTGGASGLGKATVERIVKQGGQVVLCDLPNSKGQEIASNLSSTNVVFAPTDVSILLFSLFNLNVIIMFLIVIMLRYKYN